MTIEEKAKRYDEALEKAKTLKEISTNTEVVGYMDELFPELKESEDERTRKEILDYIDKATGCKRWVAWLEKQGEQKETLCDKCKKTQPSHSCQDITALGRCALEKQDEQKSADKVEPFKVGDWVMNKDGSTFSNGSISARVSRIEGHKIWLEHGTYINEWKLKKLTD